MAFWNERVKSPKLYFDVIRGESSIGFEMPTSVSKFNCHRYSIPQGANICVGNAIQAVRA